MSSFTMTWNWRAFACVDAPCDVTRFVSETKAPGLFPFPAIRDPRWDSTLDALAPALGLTVESSPGRRGARTRVVDRRPTGRTAHVVYDAGASHAAWPIAAAYCRTRGIELGKVEDPEQARLQGRDETCRAARFGQEWAEIEGLRDGIIAVKAAECAVGQPRTYRNEESGEWAVWLGDVEPEESSAMSLYLFESARDASWGRDGRDIALRRQWPLGEQHSVGRADAGTSRWVTGRLLGTHGATGNYAELAQETWRAYGREYWPGPVAQYGDGDEGPCWGRSEYRMEGRCPGCRLETMRTTTPVSWRQPESSGVGMVVVDVFCPRCYQVGFFPIEPEPLEMPGAVLPAVQQGRMGRNEELVVSARFPRREDAGALWIAVTPSERHVAALDPLPTPRPLWSDRQCEVFRLRAGCLLPGIHHVRTYFCRRGDYALSAVGHMVQVV